MTLKERIENNIAIVLLSTAAVSFSAGWGAHAAIFSNLAPSGIAESNKDWKSIASEKGWIDKAACPAMPVELSMLSPGNNASVEYHDDFLTADFVVRTSRPLPQKDDVGIILNEEGSTNFYVEFPYFTVNETRTLFRQENLVNFPIKGDIQKRMNVWSLVIEDKNEVGSVYGSLDEIRKVSPNIFISDEVTVNLAPRK